MYPLLEKAGSKVLLYGSADYFLIGPEQVIWDAMVLVEHRSAKAFLTFAQDPAYLQISGHRTAALADTRLLPVNPEEKFTTL